MWDILSSCELRCLKYIQHFIGQEDYISHGIIWCENIEVYHDPYLQNYVTVRIVFVFTVVQPNTQDMGNTSKSIEPSAANKHQAASCDLGKDCGLVGYHIVKFWWSWFTSQILRVVDGRSIWFLNAWWWELLYTAQNHDITFFGLMKPSVSGLAPAETWCILSKSTSISMESSELLLASIQVCVSIYIAWIRNMYNITATVIIWCRLTLQCYINGGLRTALRGPLRWLKPSYLTSSCMPAGNIKYIIYIISEKY